MPTYNESLTEAGTAAQAFGAQTWRTTLSSSVLAASGVEGTRYFQVSSTANATSSVSYRDIHGLSSTANAVSSLSALASRAGGIGSVVVAGSSLTFAVKVGLGSSAAAASTLTQRHIASIMEEVLAQSSLGIAGFGALSISSSANATSSLGFGKSLGLASTAAAVSAVTLQRGAALASTASAVSSIVPVNHVTMELFNAVVAASALSARADRLAALGSGAVVTSHLRLPSAAHEAYWTNTRTMGATRWDHLKVNSIVELNGVLYGAAADGVHQLDTSGTHVGLVAWDLMDFGSPQLKTVGAAYIDGTAEGAFTLRVTTKQGEWNYQTHLANGSAETQNHRATPGRGLKAMHYRFSVLENAHFDVGAVRVEIAEAARRRG